MQQFKYNKTNYNILLKRAPEIFFTDTQSVFQVNVDTGKGVYNTGKDLYRLAISFSPKSYTAEKELIAILKLEGNPHIGKAYTSQTVKAVFIYVKGAEGISSPSYKCLLIENNSVTSTTLNNNLHFNIEISLKEFVNQLKKIILYTYTLPEEISELLFK